jgi:hypothetical protein
MQDLQDMDSQLQALNLSHNPMADNMVENIVDSKNEEEKIAKRNPDYLPLQSKDKMKPVPRFYNKNLA